MSEHVTEQSSPESSIVDLNVGGVYYSTTLSTLSRPPGSLLAAIARDPSKALRDGKGRYFLDRDGVLFRYILDFLRNSKLILPEGFAEKERLCTEAEFFKLPQLVNALNSLLITAPSLGTNGSPKTPSTPSQAQTSGGRDSLCATDQQQQQPQLQRTARPASPLATSHNSLFPQRSLSSSRSCSPSADGPRAPGFLTVAYRGTFAFGRDGLADVKFRKLNRLIVCGRVSLCREVFKDTLNESRDPDRGDCDRYTARFFLKHSFLEQAFDNLMEEGFELVGSNGSGTNSAGDIKPGMDSEESKWQHFNEFIFERKPCRL